MRKCAGLTLVELMVSMFILSIMSVVALSSFQQIIRAREIQKSHEVVLNQLSFAYTTMFNDFEQTLDANTMVFNEHLLALMQAQPPVHIDYTWEADSLKRSRTEEADTIEQSLMQHVSGLQWQWLSGEAWHDLSVPSQQDASVHGFRVLFTDSTLGEVSWTFAIP